MDNVNREALEKYAAVEGYSITEINERQVRLSLHDVVVDFWPENLKYRIVQGPHQGERGRRDFDTLPGFLSRVFDSKHLGSGK